MTRTVVCRKYKEELEGLDKAPFPGERGQVIYNTVSKKAWQAWLKHQTMLINEKRLNLMSKDTQTFLQAELEKFMDNTDYERPEGYTPPSE